jgi:hypothetical protein
VNLNLSGLTTYTTPRDITQAHTEPAELKGSKSCDGAAPETTKPITMDGLRGDPGGLGRNRTTDTRIFNAYPRFSVAVTTRKSTTNQALGAHS